MLCRAASEARVPLRPTDGAPAVRLGEGRALALSPTGNGRSRRAGRTILLRPGPVSPPRRRAACFRRRGVRADRALPDRAHPARGRVLARGRRAARHAGGVLIRKAPTVRRWGVSRGGDLQGTWAIYALNNAAPGTALPIATPPRRPAVAMERRRQPRPRESGALDRLGPRRAAGRRSSALPPHVHSRARRRDGGARIGGGVSHLLGLRCPRA